MDSGHLIMSMKLHSLSKQGLIFSFMIFFCLFGINLLIGAFGPRVLEYQSISTWNCSEPLNEYNSSKCNGVQLGKGSNWTGTIENMNKLNQQLFVIMQVQNKNPKIGLEKNIVMFVEIHAKKDQNSEWVQRIIKTDHLKTITCPHKSSFCDSIILVHEPFFSYSDYKFTLNVQNATQETFIGDVVFKFGYASKKFTLFEFWCRFVYFLLTGVVLVAFYLHVRKYSLADWTIEQKWVFALLFGLIAYDNPFFGLILLVDGWFPVMLDEILTGLFIVVLLLYWIVMVDALRKFDASERTFCSFYLPKLGFVIFFCINLLMVFMWTQISELKDPVQSHERGNVFYIFLIISSVSYILWLAYLLIRVSMDSNVPLLGVKIKFFGVFTVFIIMVTFIGIIFQLLGPSLNSSSQYLGFLSLFNLYVYMLAFVYLPSSSFFGNLDGDSLKMVVLDKDDHDYLKLHGGDHFEEAEIENTEDDEDKSFDITDNNFKLKLGDDEDYL
eukprot:TRINITY_DN3544_c0_g1_i1.p1 TRINITY_DN3544_c0_g1~~TRINITY_DN3544_c0_g1_i1.p1  ORF type:complete len:497 (+),score=88.78 TRINITY_DN3544_c0_g1_i1:45-1535(+)